ncbi:small ribosomal subunit protein eS10B-like [Bolinopsis microptera]|uniref:small ribosomal subunit protein eS10B-like n=1 Tax=Bolinopsis microptera TaxID=2820187 RepID=UPI003079A3C4
MQALGLDIGPEKEKTMLIPKKNRKAVFEHLFKEGVVVAKKDFNAPTHPNVKSVPNLQVIKAMQSLRSKGYVKEQFAWQHFYWYLENDGITFLRDYLHLPQEIVPSTLKRPTARTTTAPPKPKPQGAPAGPKSDDRDAYRSAEGKNVGPGQGFQPEFRGGYGRGAPQGQ